MDHEARTTITASNTVQRILARTSLDPRRARGTTILAPTSEEEARRTLRHILAVLNEAHQRVGGDAAPPSDAVHDELDAATVDEPSDGDDTDGYGENDLIEEEDEEEEERGVGGVADYEFYDDAYNDGSFGGVPASAAAMAGLIKNRKHHQTEGGGDDAYRTATCMICIEDFEAGDDLGVMPCSHGFHQGCLVEWVARSRLCPCCRYALPSEEKTQRL